jgi:MFS transporter, AAHS family, 4-hydroxybenzoate transporter
VADTGLSTIETSLEHQRLGALQIRVAVLCTLIQMLDAYDVNSIGWSVPSLTHFWQLPPQAFSTAFLISNVGVMVGALLSGPIGDRAGRRPLLLASVLIFAIASLASAFAASLAVLTGLRFFTGLGIGGAFPGAASLTGDYAPARRRALMIMATFTGAPVGGFLGGQIVALLLLPHFGWRAIFVFGGIIPLVLFVIMVVWLPESPRLLAVRKNLAPRQRALLQQLGIRPGETAAQPIDVPHGSPVRMLLGKGYALQTILLWIIFFCSLLDLFLLVFWLPEVLHLGGLSPAQAVFATSIRDLGAVAAVLYLGWLIDRFGPEKSLSWHFVASMVFMALIALVAMPYAILLLAIFFTGMTVIGSQTGANAACGKLYPARMRTSGLGWALGVGRLGGIAAGPFGGALLALGFKPPHIFLSACLFAAIAAVATGLLFFRGNHEGPAEEPVAAT